MASPLSSTRRVARRVLFRAPTRRAYGAIRNAAARVNPEPVIILGKEKSGTTAIAALLAEHTGSTVTLDIQALFGIATARMLSGESSVESVVRGLRREFSRDIIKQPSLTWLYPQVRDVFPSARYVMIVRDPRDNVRSVLDRMGLPGNLERLDETHTASIPPAWRWHLDPNVLDLTGESYIELAAARWNKAADVYLENRSEMVLVRYEDFVADRTGCLHDLAEKLGLPHWRDVSGSVDRQFQGRGNREMSWNVFFGTRNLATIERVCEKRMTAFSYERILDE